MAYTYELKKLIRRVEETRPERLANQELPMRPMCSLLDVLVFGRIAGQNAAIYAKEKAKEGRLTLDHVRKFHKELEEAGIDRKRISPILLPDYSNPLLRERQLSTYYQGTIR